MKKLFFIAIMAVSSTAFAQKMSVESGDYNFLKNSSALNVKFDFNKALFFNENMDESRYIEKRLKDIEKDKGSEEAQKWKNDWDESKNVSFKEKFISAFNKNSEIKLASSSNSPYTLTVKTIWIYPGWFGGVMSQPAKVSTVLVFSETDKPNHVLLQILSEKAPGDGNFVGVANNNDRIAEGYAKTGKSLAKLIQKKVRK